jgi:ATP-dependent RNA helicase DDX52/ROK1
MRLSSNIPNGKFTCITLSKSNVGLATSNTLGSGNTGLDCLVSTPLRLVECLERGMKLSGVRLLVLDEADRLLDASDGRNGGGSNDSSGSGNVKKKRWKKDKKKKHDDDSDSEDESEDEEEEDTNNTKQQQQSGSSQSRTFLQQIDSILANIPNSATRALFSATLGPSVRHLSESILRSPIDISTGIHAKTGGNSAAGGVASEYIHQELKFVGREEGKVMFIICV